LNIPGKGKSTFRVKDVNKAWRSREQQRIWCRGRSGGFTVSGFEWGIPGMRAGLMDRLLAAFL
jgi:hypothetical protein